MMSVATVQFIVQSTCFISCFRRHRHLAFLFVEQNEGAGTCAQAAVLNFLARAESRRDTTGNAHSINRSESVSTAATSRPVVERTVSGTPWKQGQIQSGLFYCFAGGTWRGGDKATDP